MNFATNLRISERSLEHLRVKLAEIDCNLSWWYEKHTSDYWNMWLTNFSPMIVKNNCNYIIVYKHTTICGKTPAAHLMIKQLFYSQTRITTYSSKFWINRKNILLNTEISIFIIGVPSNVCGRPGGCVTPHFLENGR